MPVSPSKNVSSTFSPSSSLNGVISVLMFFFCETAVSIVAVGAPFSLRILMTPPPPMFLMKFVTERNQDSGIAVSTMPSLKSSKISYCMNAP